MKRVFITLDQRAHLRPLVHAVFFRVKSVILPSRPE